RVQLRPGGRHGELLRVLRGAGFRRPERRRRDRRLRGDGADPGAELTGSGASGVHPSCSSAPTSFVPERGRPSKSVVTKSNRPTALSISGLLAASFQAGPVSVRPRADLVPTVLLASEPPSGALTWRTSPESASRLFSTTRLTGGSG